MSFPKRGALYWVNLDPTVGSEIAKTRPALVISNNIGNEYADRVIIAPVSSGNVQRVDPFEVRLEAGEADLRQPCKVLLDQIRTVDKSRLSNRIGVLTPERMTDVNDAIRLSLAV